MAKKKNEEVKNEEELTPEPTPTPTLPVKKEEDITLPAATVKTLLEKIEKLEKDRDMLVEVADKARLNNYNVRNQTNLIKKAMINFYDDKMMVGWKSVIDEVRKDESGRWFVNQQTEILFSDGTSKIVSIRDFQFNKKQEEAEIISESNNKDGSRFYKLQRKNGETVELSDVFIN